MRIRVLPMALRPSMDHKVADDAIKSKVERIPVTLNFDPTRVVGQATICPDGYADVELFGGVVTAELTEDQHPFSIGYRKVAESVPDVDGLTTATEIQPLTLSLPDTDFMRTVMTIDQARKLLVVDDIMQLSVDLIRQVGRGEVFVSVRVADIETQPDGSNRLTVERIGPPDEPVEELAYDTKSEKFYNFEQAFATSSAGAVRTCVCGRVFYNPDGGWTFEDGELERLEASGATSLPHPCGEIEFEGKLFAIDCDCWRQRAARIAAWLDEHAVEVADYLTLEKQRKTEEANASPVVR